eukprot:6489597-Amphidinium_carterae.1
MCIRDSPKVAHSKKRSSQGKCEQAWKNDALKYGRTGMLVLDPRDFALCVCAKLVDFAHLTSLQEQA